MRRAAWIFLAAIFLPSLGLAWLAVHSVRDQQVILEHQQVVICQNLTDSLARNVQERMDQVRNEFSDTAQRLLDDNRTPENLADGFNRKLTLSWPLAEVAFAVSLDGRIYSPRTDEGIAAKTFRDENDRFLANRENAEVYAANLNSFTLANSKNAPASPPSDGTTLGGAGGTWKQSRNEELNSAQPQRARDLSEPVPNVADIPAVPNAPAAPLEQQPVARRELQVKKSQQAQAAPAPPPAPAAQQAQSAQFTQPADNTAQSAAQTQSAPSDVINSRNSISSEQMQTRAQRKVAPQQALVSQKDAPLSNIVPEESDFRRVVGAEKSGLLARFLDNKLRLMVWFHSQPSSSIVFGAQLNRNKLVESLVSIVQDTASASPENYSSFRSATPKKVDYCLAVLDDNGKPVAQSVAKFSTDWKRPFVSTEIGDALPHWEAALYLTDPQQITRTARTLQWTLGLIVLMLVAAIAAGGWLIGADVRRQMRLAQQKTDFVSNVSHELKTPLTSIRMFADLLAEGRVDDEEKRGKYLRIISAESARLTRLINNVLDFARMERGVRKGEQRPCDLVEVARDVIETCRPHLESGSIAFSAEIEAENLSLTGDRDALAQIILNLISNAEKYGGGEVFVRVRRQETPGGVFGCVDVMDCGPGIPPKQVQHIFEPFVRLDDSLSSGVQGTGLGLTLARRLARAHHGDVSYSMRASGGSCFTLSVPLT
jgi:signal transduction histidine kinase